MNFKIIILILLVLSKAYSLMLGIVRRRSANNRTPENVADVFDAETYAKWKKYSAECSRHEIVTTIVTFIVSVVLFITNVYAAFAGLFPGGVFMQLFAVILLDSVVSEIVGAILGYYSTMVIEEKYGFNRSTMKTFVTDQIRNFIIGLLLSTVLAGLLALFYRAMGDAVIILFAAAVFCLTLIISFLYPILSRIGNKFVPLEEGELRTQLMALLTKHGYQVKAIEVMDASRRTTKLNAYFTGFGKLKTIVLYDNLVNAMSTEEICSVFAHELGHGLHKDVLKQQIMNFGNLLIMAVLAWLSVKFPALHSDFGFSEVNYGFACIAFSTALGIIQPLTGMAMNAYSRFAEYRADRQAVKEGYGPAMITALKKLAKENFAHLAPSRVNVVLEYSHPPLHSRIEAVEKAINE